MEVLKVEGICQNFGGLRVLEDVSFGIEEGERVAIIGPNGAGKTTLFNVLSGFIRPTAGRVLLLGNDVTRMPPHRRASLGLARSFQRNTLFPKLSLLANVLVAIKGVQTGRYQMVRPLTADKESVERARELLGLVGLWEERETTVTTLSHGQQRLVEIIMALASGPRLLMLDEPTAGLTTGESVDLTKVIDSLKGDTAVFFCAHDLELVFSLAHRVVVLYYGQILAEGTPEEIQADSRVREIYLGVEH